MAPFGRKSVAPYRAKIDSYCNRWKVGKGRVITVSAELLEPAIALVQAEKQVKAEILDERRPIVAAAAA